MVDRSAVPIPPSCYDPFLYALVCDQRNGTQLSVISAFSRMNTDPWEEAARLAAMPRAAAEKTLISILGQAADISCDWSEVEATVARLIQLLPPNGGHGRTTIADTARGDIHQATYWLVWLGFVITVSIMSARDQVKVADPAATQSGFSSMSVSESYIANEKK